MRYLSLAQVLEIHRRVVEMSGGVGGIRDLGAIVSSVAQPQMTFDGQDLYPTIEAKATAICFSLVMNHPFLDGNKRVGHAAMESFLVLNGYELQSPVDDSENVILRLAAGQVSRDELLKWVSAHIERRT